MSRPLTPAERDEIIAHLRDGKSVNGTAKLVNRAPSTVSRVGRAAGIDSLKGAHSRLTRAHEARKAYGAEARAQRIAAMHERICEIIERMGQPHVAYNFGGKDNTYEERTFDRPTSDALKDYAAAVAQLTRAEMEVVKYDERGDTVGSAFDAWLAMMAGGSPDEQQP